jgi:hypothetical protein
VKLWWQRRESARPKRTTPSVRYACRRLEPLEARELLAGQVFDVTTVKDTLGVGSGSLRQAILDVNKGGGGDSITFHIKDAVDPNHPVIALSQRWGDLPPLVVKVSIVGDGKTTINGSLLAGFRKMNGLVFTIKGNVSSASNSWVSNLTVSGFSGSGILIDRVSGVTVSNDTLIKNKFAGLAIVDQSTDTTVQFCNIGEIRVQPPNGRSISTFTAAGNGVGVLISGRSNQNFIGSGEFSEDGTGNFIGGNTGVGIQIVDSNSNQISGNGIGVAYVVANSGPVRNGSDGILIDSSFS